jgi:hypothetical protein
LGPIAFEGQRLLDAALDTALQNFQTSEQTGLFYMRFDSHRCLAEVYLRRGELEDAEGICAAAAAIVSGTESRVSQLWLGPGLFGCAIGVSDAARERATAGRG